ncbi:hypothetical protein [Nocardioides plantarum]|uniref:Uncharacterized protein n=1 Tax=Nocardioides plantarum TaxID=29299 RepID=A0ABV5K6K7_9ACTN|nr:hypothetical protein [Nocardioides plantarum]
MRWRVAVAVLLALVVGAAGGWAYASMQDDDAPDTGPVAAAIEPIPATPSLPVKVAQPDPDDDTLEPEVVLDPTELQIPVEGDPEYVVRLPVPRGWKRTFDGETKFGFTVPGNSPKSYGLRVQIIAAQRRSVDSALRARISSLQSAVLQGNLGDLDYTLNKTGDGFTATYVDTDGYNRVTVEKFYEGEDDNAFVTVAAYGRFRDRAGLEDLSARIGIELSTSEPGQNP